MTLLADQERRRAFVGRQPMRSSCADGPSLPKVAPSPYPAGDGIVPGASGRHGAPGHDGTLSPWVLGRSTRRRPSSLTAPATWDARFPDDGPAYERAATELAPPLGGTVLDLGSGTGRALGALRAAVGDAGRVVAVDVTWQMLTAAGTAGRGRDRGARPRRCGPPPACRRCLRRRLRRRHHPPPPRARPRSRRAAAGHSAVGAPAIFHPIGRAALATRHGGTLSDRDLLDRRNLEPELERHGWTFTSIDDGVDRYLAVATRA